MPGVRISVAMCTYNGADFLPAQLESIAAQTRKADEIVICDDGSTDETTLLIPGDIVLHKNDKNLGTVKNFEKAIRLCSGDVIALSDQDDVWREDKLALIEEAFSRNPHVGLVFSDAEIVNQELQPLGRRMWDEVGFDAHKRKLVAQGRALEVLITGWTVSGATMAFRSEYAKLALPVPTTIPMIHDGWIALAVAAVSDVAIIDDTLIKYRQHRRQQIGAPVLKLQTQPSAREALKRRNSSADLQRILDTLRDRLSTQGNGFDCRNALAFAGNYSRHLGVRANLPQRRLSRVPAVLRELLSWRYHEYANGFKSAAKDLVSQ
jgi:glycosyltransferase involved in cell wall biosynthesis